MVHFALSILLCCVFALLDEKKCSSCVNRNNISSKWGIVFYYISYFKALVDGVAKLEVDEEEENEEEGGGVC